MADLDPRDFAYGYIHNWERHQHYKHRRPPWIKDYIEQLQNDDYLSLTLAERGLLQGLRLHYADIQHTPNLRRGFALTTSRLTSILAVRVTNVQLASLNHAGFVDFSASNVLAPLVLPASATAPTEDREQRTETEKDSPPTPTIEPALAVILEPESEAAFLLLAAIDKPGYQEPRFTRARFAPVVGAHPVANLAGEAEALADWETHGKGAGQPVKDGIGRWRNWLKRAPRLAVVADRPRFVDRYDRSLQPYNPDFLDAFALPGNS